MEHKEHNVLCQKDGQNAFENGTFLKILFYIF